MKLLHSPEIVIFVLVIFVALCMGCSDGLFTGEESKNLPPEIWLSSGPVENDTISYMIHFYWSGWDPDGEIDFFEFVITDGHPVGFAMADTQGVDKWTRTCTFDSIFKVSADSFPRPYDDDPLYTVYDQTHTFFIRAVDMEGIRSKAANISFTAWTLAPVIKIDRPKGSVRTYSTVITFGWTGKDPIDSPTNFQDPDSIRCLYYQVLNHENIYDPTFMIIDDMNENPEWYEDKWGPWISYTAPGDSGRIMVVGDDEILEINRSHIFAVQAKDEAGAVTSIFQKDQNVRRFLVSWKAGPVLTVSEQYLGTSKFIGLDMNAIENQLPPGIPLTFSWKADASAYGGEITGYRYGWDVQDLNDPDDWEVDFSPFHLIGPERTLYSGNHTFYIQTLDNGGKVTMGRISVEIIPFSMDRAILWVDDYPLSDVPNLQRTNPTETEHDVFWTDLLSKVDGFEPERDQFDCEDYNFNPPEITVTGKYKNIVWTYNSSSNTSFGQVIQFTPESLVGQSGDITINYLSIFLKKGGHLWTLGRSDGASGGLSLAFPTSPEFPASFKFDMTPVLDDTSSVFSMPYQDYCVSVVDKIIGIFRIGPEMPGRGYDRDALRFMYKEPDDTLAGKFTGFPEEVLLWDEITDCPNCFFNPQIRGFTYVEMYNVEYWMKISMIAPLHCFHPLYRMRTRSTFSAVDHAVVALVINKYADVVPQVNSGVPVAANSFHFGLPLWFFDHAAVDSIATEIFDEWGILLD